MSETQKGLGMCQDLNSSAAALHQVEMQPRPGHLPELRLAEHPAIGRESVKQDVVTRFVERDVRPSFPDRRDT